MKRLLQMLVLDLTKSTVIAVWFHCCGIGNMSILQWIVIFMSVSIFLGFNVE